MSSEVGVSPERKTFSKIKSFMDLPNLIDVQRRSYERFLQMNLLPEEREESGLQAVFTSVFPFSDFRGACELQFVKYAIGNWECKCGRLKGLEHLRMDCRACGARIVTAHPHEETVSCPKCGTQNPNRVTLCDVCGNPVDLQMKYSVAECQERGMTYSVPLKVTFRLFVYDKDPDTGVKTMRDAKEEEVFFGDIPLMTEHGTFVINGTERVIVSQLHRSPGVFFTKESAHGFLAKIIPYRGSWVEFEYDQKGILFVRIDRKRKFPATIFLRALGLETDESILRQFYAPVAARFERGRAHLTITRNVVKQEELKERYARVKRETKVIFAGIKLSADDQKEIARKGSIERSVDGAAIEKACFLADVVDLSTGEVLFEAGQEVGPDAVEQLKERGIKEVEIFFPDWDLSGEILVSTIRKDTHKTKNEAILEIYRRLRPGDPPTYESAKNLFEGMFFDPKKYDFSRVGRFKFNIKLEADSSEDTRTLTAQDIYRVVAYLLRLKRDVGRTDDIDNLGNRRVRSVGELLENQFRIGLVRMERAIKEKMSVHQDIDSAMPHDLINSKPVIASIKEFFGSSQLSQFMDQTNPLSEVTHKRRLSALGPGGLSRERAGFEVRDVHPTHYGRVCPIETPEGPNIGLDLVALLLRAHQRLRLHRDAVQAGREGPRHRPLPDHAGRRHLLQARPDRREEGARGGERAGQAGPQAPGGGPALLLLPLGMGRGELRHRAGQRRDGRRGPHQGGPGHRPVQRGVHHRGAGQGRLQGHLAQAARVGRDGAHPVPRARRREPRADGLQHAAPGRPAAPGRGAARRHRPRARRSPAIPARSCSPSAAASWTRSTRSGSSCASRGARPAARSSARTSTR